MPDIINEYQKWKQQGEDLRVQAKNAMENRFRDLLSEAVHISEEYRTDFGAVLKPPPAVTAFRYKASAKPKAKKPAGARPKTSRPQVKSRLIGWMKKPRLERGPKLNSAMTQPQMMMTSGVRQVAAGLRLSVVTAMVFPPDPVRSGNVTGS